MNPFGPALIGFGLGWLCLLIATKLREGRKSMSNEENEKIAEEAFDEASEFGEHVGKVKAYIDTLQKIRELESTCADTRFALYHLQEILKRQIIAEKEAIAGNDE